MFFSEICAVASRTQLSTVQQRNTSYSFNSSESDAVKEIFDLTG